jgi:hypothetical protein
MVKQVLHLDGVDKLWPEVPIFFQKLRKFLHFKSMKITFKYIRIQNTSCKAKLMLLSIFFWLLFSFISTLEVLVKPKNASLKAKIWLYHLQTMKLNAFCWHTVFPHIVSAETILFWIWSQYIRTKVTVHKCAETIQRRKLFKRGNCMRKYSIK